MGDPVGPPLATDGQGLCGASAVSIDVARDFGGLQTPETFNAGMTVLLDATYLKSREESTLRSILDLSNNVEFGLKNSFGDFTGSDPKCGNGGCPLYKNDDSTSFMTRLRGFLNVTDALVNKPVHIGFYADDAVSLQIFDSKQRSYPVITRPPVLGTPSWRTTNAVTFLKPGVYPVEILYVEITTFATLEMTLFVGAFDDFELDTGKPASTNLKTAGFSLFKQTAFSQTVNGMDAFPDPNKCQQCNRQFAGLPGNGSCNNGYYCNEAALCAPCTTSLFCGESCSPCGGAQPFCLNLNGKFTCVPCRNDQDCPADRHCDPEKHECQDCAKDTDCERGKICNPSHTCVPCSTSDSCAGVSCNCCPKGAKICAPLAGETLPTCVECTSDVDCGGRKCDIQNGRCVDSVLPCNTAERCGRQCARCPNDRPYCVLAIPDVGSPDAACAECRNDNDCGGGKYCIGGECESCSTNRHCGPRCGSCGGDTPFCYVPAPQEGIGSEAICVRCVTDVDCHGGRCDSRTHKCDSTCPMSCGKGTFCDGARCVSCYSDSQCCGGSCNIAAGQCERSCNDSTGCLGTEHCAASDKECKPGKRNPNETPPPCNYGICSTAPLGGRGGRASDSTGAALLAALLGAMVLATRGNRGGQHRRRGRA